MTGTATDLLAAIWERPHDDLPRLTYADWLDDQGTPEQAARAEFIRVQCELAKRDADDPPEPTTDTLCCQWINHPAPLPAWVGRAALAARANALEKRHARAWRAEVPKPPPGAWYVRGFFRPPLRRLTPAAVKAFPAELLRSAPLWEFGPTAPAVAPALARAGWLRVQLTDPVAASLSAGLAPHLTALRLADAPAPGTAALAEVFSSQHLTHLTTLHAWNRRLPDGAVAHLLAKSGSPLRALDLHGVGLDDADLVALAGSPRCGQLRELNLGSNPRVTAAGWVRFVGSRALAPIRFLGLAENPAVGDEAAAALAASTHASGLRMLTLHETSVGDTGGLAFASSPHLARLALIEMSRTRVSKHGTAALRARFGPGLAR